MAELGAVEGGVGLSRENPANFPNGNEATVAAETAELTNSRREISGRFVITTSRRRYGLCKNLSESNQCPILFSQWCSAYSSRQMIIDIVPFQLIDEICDLGITVDDQAFHSRDLCEISKMFNRQSLAEACVMRPSRKDPRRSCCLEVGLGCPDGSGDG